MKQGDRIEVPSETLQDVSLGSDTWPHFRGTFQRIDEDGYAIVVFDMAHGIEVKMHQGNVWFL